MKRLNRPVEMVSVFHEDCSYPKPVKFKHKLDNGKVITINVDKILSEKHRKWGRSLPLNMTVRLRSWDSTEDSFWNSPGTDLNGDWLRFRRQEMRLNYLDYQIVYLEETGDTSIYRKNKEIIRANIPTALSKENLIDNLAYIMAAPGLLASKGLYPVAQ